MSLSRRRLVFTGIYGCLLGGLAPILGGCGGGGSVDDSAKMDPAQEKALADQKRANEEFHTKKTKK